LASLLV